jgi:hypothetical protein
MTPLDPRAVLEGVRGQDWLQENSNSLWAGTVAHLAVAVSLDFPLAQGVPEETLLHALPLCAELAVAGPFLDAIGARDVLREAAALRQPIAQRALQPQLLVV